MIKRLFFLLIYTIFVLGGDPAKSEEEERLVEMGDIELLLAYSDDTTSHMANWLRSILVDSYFSPIDLNGDGIDEIIAEAPRAKVNELGKRRYGPRYLLYVVLSVDYDAIRDGSDDALRWLGTIPVPLGTRWYPRGENPELWVSTKKSGEWLSLTNGPMQYKTNTFNHYQTLLGGHRFCWTDTPIPINWPHLGWSGSAEQMRFGLPYKEGDPGYFKLVPETQDCPEDAG